MHEARFRRDRRAATATAMRHHWMSVFTLTLRLVTSTFSEASDVHASAVTPSVFAAAAQLRR